MIRIFVSHSSKDRALTDAVCAELKAGAAAGAYATTSGVDALVDYERLQDGAPWPKQLHEWLAKCHAGLILLTRDALASDWVLKEATILTWRQSLNDRFLVFVACDRKDVTEEALKQYRYGPLSLRTIERIDSLDPATIAASVRQSIGQPNPPRTLFDRLAGALSDIMTDAVKPNALKALAERLRVDPPAWDLQRSEREQYLEEIARRLLSESLGGFNGINEVIAELDQTVKAESLTEILNFLAPYWVDAEAAGRLRALTIREPRGAAALNTTEPAHCGLMYVRRAHHLGFNFMLPNLAGGDGGQTAREIGNQILEYVKKRGWAKSTDSDDKVKQVLLKWPNPVYAVLPEPIDPEVLAELRDQFTGVTFVMATGAQLTPDERFADVDWLRPELATGTDDRVLTDFNAAVSIIENKRGQG